MDYSDLRLTTDKRNVDSSGTKIIGKCGLDAECGGGSGGGYGYHFVALLPNESDLVCKICQLPSRNALLSSCCGHTFCNSCVDNFMACPVCRNNEFPVVQNKQVDRAVKNLRVYCTNEKEGCEWQGEVNDIPTHLDHCQYENVKCKNDGCDLNVQRQLLRNHTELDCPHREVNCWHCHVIGKHWFIEGKHKDECSKFPMPCPNGCKIGHVAREDLDEHRKTCPLEMIECEYYDMGCDVKIIRKDIKDHDREYVEEHLHMVKCELARTRRDLVQAQKDAATAGKRLADLQNTFQKQLNDVETQGQENINRLETQFYKSLRQLHKNCNPYTLKLDSLALMSSSGKQVVPVVLKMENFSEMKRDKEWWYSDPFYVYKKKYKLRLLVSTAGDDGKETAFLSVWLSLLNSSCYNEMELPLVGKIKVLNQINNKEHHCVDVADDSNWKALREWRNPFFISHDELNAVSNSCDFLKNDNLFFWVFVKTRTVTASSQPHL